MTRNSSGLMVIDREALLNLFESLKPSFSKIVEHYQDSELLKGLF